MNADQSAEDAAFASDVDVKQRKKIYVSYDICIVQNIFTHVHYEGDGMYIVDGKENIANHR